MNISATPIKPQSFGMSAKETQEVIKEQNESYNKYSQAADTFYTNFIQRPSIKKPLAVVASVALAGLTAYLFGSKIAGGIGRLFPDVVSPKIKNEAGELVKNGKYFENVIKKGVGKAEKVIGDIAAKGGTKEKIAGFLTKGEGVAKNAYKTITSIGTKKLPAEQLPLKKFQNLIGVATAAIMLPRVCKADGNKDGVSDIAQKGQNAYTGAKTEINNSIKSINVIGQILDLVS